MPLTNEDRANAAKMGMEMMKKKVAGVSKYADQMAAAGREEATQASEVGASQTTMNEKTGKNANKAKIATNALDMADDAIARSKNVTDSMKKR